MQYSDYQEPACPFDNSLYQKEPNIPESKGRVDVKAVLAVVDKLNSELKYDAVRIYLENALVDARKLQDKAGELGLLSELIGVYRKQREKEKGLDAVRSAFSLILELGLEGTATAGTIWLNGATALREFGEYEEALSYFNMSCRAYAETIAPYDYRFAGLFNNMGTCFVALDRYDEAMAYYRKALTIVKGNGLTPIEEAVTYMNMAEAASRMEPENTNETEKYVDACLGIFLDPSTPKDDYYSYFAKNCASGLKDLGFFRDAKKLLSIAEQIDESIS